MQYSVDLTLESATLVGDRREPSGYFIPSRDFIPGSVLRAALARAIREGCPYDTVNGSSNWVEFADGPLCSDCSWRGLCSNFGDLRFSHLYRDGARVAPLTAYRCKNDGRHPMFDTLLNSGAPVCPECGGTGERVSGYLNGPNSTLDVDRHLLMRLEMDPYRQTAREGQLYALRVLNRGQVFKGRLVSPTSFTGLPAELTLRLGAKTSVGLGRVKVRFEEETTSKPDLLGDRIRRFQEKARAARDSQDGETCYLSLTLLADALPERELKASRERVSTEALKRQLLESILPPDSPLAGRLGEVLRVAADFEVYGGYCTAEHSCGRRRASLYVSAGSVFLCRMQGPLDDELLQSLRSVEERGLGRRTEDGYGAVSVCDEFHLHTGGVAGEDK